MKLITKYTLLSLITASSIYANDALSNGQLSGEVSLYNILQDNKTSLDEGYSVGSLYLNYATQELNGFKATVGGITNHPFYEKQKNDYWKNKKHIRATLTEANISYSNDLFTVIAGRQPLNLEWIEDYHNAVLGIITYNDIIVTTGVTNKILDADEDSYLPKIADIKDKNGDKTKTAFIDLEYSLNDNLVLGSYYMDTKGLFSGIGGFVSTSIQGISTTLKYAQTDEKDGSVQDGKIFACDFGYTIQDNTNIYFGYILSGNKNGTGNLDYLGESINPFEDGNQVYGTDAKTWYLNASTEVAGFGLGALYGETKYLNGTTKEKEKELNLFVDKEVYKNLTASVIYADVKTHDKDDKYNYASLQLTYSF